MPAREVSVVRAVEGVVSARGSPGKMGPGGRLIGAGAMGFLQFKSLDQRRLKLKPQSSNTGFSLTFLSFDE